MAEHEEVLPQGLVFDGDSTRPITREEAEHGLHDPSEQQEKPADPPTPASAADDEDKPQRPSRDR